MPTADTPDLRISYRIAGERGSCVVLIIGLGLGQQAWMIQRRALAERHRVLTFDNRGTGATEAPRGPYSIRQMADDTAALMSHVGWDRAHVVGISMGGMIAQELALSHRDRVRSLALLASSPGGGGPFRPVPTWRGLRLLARLHLGRSSSYLDTLRRLLLSPEFEPAAHGDDLLAELAATLGERPPLTSVLFQLAAFLRFSGRRRLERLAAVPTLIVQPGRDLVIRPRESERLHRLVPGSRLVTFERAGHGVTLEEAGAVNRLLLEHFAEAEAAAGAG